MGRICHKRKGSEIIHLEVCKLIPGVDEREQSDKAKSVGIFFIYSKYSPNGCFKLFSSVFSF